MWFLRFFLLIAVGVCTTRPALAQHEFDNWCFGFGQANIPAPRYPSYPKILLSFLSGRPVATNFFHDLQLDSWGGIFSACISDATGRLLLRSEGHALYNGTGVLIPNSTLNTMTPTDRWPDKMGLQVTLITPSPGRPGCYHVFFWNKAADPRRGLALAYVVVDMRRNAGQGGIAERSAPVAYSGMPGLTAVRHANNRDFWILTRDEDSRGFVALRLGPQGLAVEPVVSLAGEARYPLQPELQAAPDARHLAAGGIAVRGRTAGSPGVAWGGVCLYDFDPATGAVTREQALHEVALSGYGADGQGRLLPLNATALYGTSFSPDGSKLYTTEPGPYPVLQNSRRFSDIWQYDLTQPTTAAIGASRYLVSNVPTPAPAAVDTTIYPYQLQLTPTGEVWTRFDSYVPYNPVTNVPSALYAAAIRHPNVAGVGCGFARRGFTYLPGHLPDYFPNIIPNMLYAPAALNYEAACPDDSVQFWASSAGDPAGLRWDFGEPASGAANAATGQYVAHRYARGGAYPVRLTLADGRVLTQTVTVNGAAADFTHENVFTPNADGQSDWFTPVRQPLPGGRLRVFSRWGPLVYQTTDAALRWDGAGATAGEYFYQLDYPDCLGARRQLRGTVTLAR